MQDAVSRWYGRWRDPVYRCEPFVQLMAYLPTTDECLAGWRCSFSQFVGKPRFVSSSGIFEMVWIRAFIRQPAYRFPERSSPFPWNIGGLLVSLRSFHGSIQLSAGYLEQNPFACQYSAICHGSCPASGDDWWHFTAFITLWSMRARCSCCHGFVPVRSCTASCANGKLLKFIFVLLSLYQFHVTPRKRRFVLYFGQVSYKSREQTSVYGKSVNCSFHFFR